MPHSKIAKSPTGPAPMIATSVLCVLPMKLPHAVAAALIAQAFGRRCLPAMVAPMTELERLIQLLAKLPGLGPRSARRAALHLLKKRESLMQPLAASLSETA